MLNFDETSIHDDVHRVVGAVSGHDRIIERTNEMLRAHLRNRVPIGFLAYDAVVSPM